MHVEHTLLIQEGVVSELADTKRVVYHKRKQLVAEIVGAVGRVDHHNLREHGKHFPHSAGLEAKRGCVCRLINVQARHISVRKVRKSLRRVCTLISTSSRSTSRCIDCTILETLRPVTTLPAEQSHKAKLATQFKLHIKFIQI